MLKRLCLATIVAVIFICGSAPAEPPTESSVHVRIEARLREQRTVGKSSWFSGGFQPNYLEVQRGQRVIIELVSVEGTHSLAIPELGLRTGPVTAGQSTELTFVADRAGDFEIKCEVVCGQFHRRMRGTLVVNEPEEP